MEQKYIEAYERGLRKVRHLDRNLDAFPHATRDGVWLTNKEGHWTGGFWTGLIWLEYLHSGEQAVAARARDWALRLQSRISDNKTHDQGFIFGPSCYFGYNLTGDKAFLPLIHAGARNMIGLHNPHTGLILAWDEPGYEGVAIVDTAMNVPLIWLSGLLDGDMERQDLARTLMANIRTHHIRPDFTTFHVARWDKEYRITGDTHQGFAPESCWSRGLAWAIYGFANMYRHTGEETWLETSLKMAEYFFSHLNDNGLPAWDFVFRNDKEQPIDAAAGSIAAAGAMLTAWLLNRKGDPTGEARSLARGKAMLDALIDTCLYTDIERYGIIEKVIIDLPRKSGIGESTMYGDYYFMEALYRLHNLDNDEKLELLY